MLLQVALDSPGDFAVAPDLEGVADIVEIGTRLLKAFGLGTVGVVRSLVPSARILVDAKTADGGAKETALIAEAGAEFTTYLAQVAPATHAAVLATARERSLAVMVDSLGDDYVWREPAFPPPAGDFYLCLHAPIDAQAAGIGFLATRQAAADARAAGYRLALAGGIGPATLDRVIACEPDIVVVGSAITGAPDPTAAAAAIKALLPKPGTGWPSKGMAR